MSTIYFIRAITKKDRIIVRPGGGGDVYSPLGMEDGNRTISDPSKSKINERKRAKERGIENAKGKGEEDGGEGRTRRGGMAPSGCCGR